MPGPIGDTEARLRDAEVRQREINAIVAKLLVLLGEAEQDLALFQGLVTMGGCAATLKLTFGSSCAGLPPVAGVVVTWTQGATTATATSNSSGVAQATVGTAGAWTYSAAMTGYTTATGSQTAVCGSTVAASVTLSYIGTCPGAIVGCLCSPTPGTITMVSSDHVVNGGQFQDATFAWGATPVGLAAVIPAAYCYLSTASFVDAAAQTYRYLLDCSGAILSLTRVYAAPNIYSGGAYRDTNKYLWNIGAAPNTCTPFSATVGAPASGLGPVTITLS